jgi:hypothetical protein
LIPAAGPNLIETGSSRGTQQDERLRINNGPAIDAATPLQSCTLAKRKKSVYTELIVREKNRHLETGLKNLHPIWFSVLLLKPASQIKNGA